MSSDRPRRPSFIERHGRNWYAIMVAEQYADGLAAEQRRDYVLDQARLYARTIGQRLSRQPGEWPWSSSTTRGLTAWDGFERKAERYGIEWARSYLDAVNDLRQDRGGLDFEKIVSAINRNREPDGSPPTQETLADSLGVGARGIRLALERDGSSWTAALAEADRRLLAGS